MSKRSRPLADFIALAQREARPHFVAPDADEMASMLVTGWMWTKILDDKGVTSREALLNRMRALRN